MSAALETRASLAAKREEVHRNAWKSDDSSVDKSEVVSVNDELLFLRYYTKQLSVLNESLVKLPYRVQACASVYFRRFYLCHSINEHHPKYVMITCLFLASKVLESRMDASTICHRANKGSWDKEVLKLEVPLLEALQFKLVVGHPHMAALAWMDELQTEKKIVVQRVAVEEAINSIMTTDAGLLFSPAVIAAGCVWNCVESESDRRIAASLMNVSEATLAELTEFLSEGRSNILPKQVTPIEKLVSAWTKKHKKKEKKKKPKKEETKKRERENDNEEEVKVEAKKKHQQAEEKDEVMLEDDFEKEEFTIKTTIKKE